MELVRMRPSPVPKTRSTEDDSARTANSERSNQLLAQNYRHDRSEESCRATDTSFHLSEESSDSRSGLKVRGD